MLSQFDPVVLLKFPGYRDRTRDLATRMLNRQGAASTRITEALLDLQRWKSHGQMIGHEDARQLAACSPARWCRAAPARVLTPQTARVTRRILDAAGIAQSRLDDTPIDSLMAAQKEICDESYMRHDFARDGAVTMLGVALQPVIDGVSFPEHPELAAAAGHSVAVPMMIGCTTSEYLTHSTMVPDLDDDAAGRLLDPRVRPVGLAGHEIVARYRAHLPHHSGKGLWRAIGGDLVFQNPATRFARVHARHAPAYRYLYGSIEQDEGGARPGAEVRDVWLRAAHSAADTPGETDFAMAVHRIWASFIANDTPKRPDGRDWPPFGEEALNVLRLDGCRIDRRRRSVSQTSIVVGTGVFALLSGCLEFISLDATTCQLKPVVVMKCLTQAELTRRIGKASCFVTSP